MISAMLLAAFLAASSAEPTPRPTWCQRGWVCVPAEEIAADARYKIDLAERLAVAEAKSKRRLGLHYGCGVGATLAINEDWNVKGLPAPAFCGVIFGF